MLINHFKLTSAKSGPISTALATVMESIAVVPVVPKRIGLPAR